MNPSLVATIERLSWHGRVHSAGIEADVRILLPTVRCLVTTERTPRLVWERRVEGAWTPLSFHALTSAEQGDVRAYVASGGYSADPRVEGGVIDGRGHMAVTWKAVTT